MSYETLLRAIQVSENPICIVQPDGWAIYQTEWANELLEDPSIVGRHKYFLDHEKTGQVVPVSTALDMQKAISNT